MQLGAVGLGDVGLGPLRAGRRRVGLGGGSRGERARRRVGRSAWRRERSAGGSLRNFMARLGLGLAALGRPGYLNVGHGARAGRRPLGRRAARAHPRGARRRLRGRASATSTPPAPTGAARSSSASGCARAQPGGVHDQLQVGLRLHRRLGGRRRPAGGQAPRRRDVPAPARRDAREPRRRGSTLYQIHSATPDSGVLANDAVLSAMVETGVPLGVQRQRRRAGRDDRPRAWRWASSAPSRRPGTCTSAPPRRSRCAAAAGLKVIVKEALANGRLAAVTPRRSPPRWRSRGRRRAQRRRVGGRAALEPARAGRRPPVDLPELIEDSAPTGRSAPLAWNCSGPMALRANGLRTTGQPSFERSARAARRRARRTTARAARSSLSSTPCAAASSTQLLALLALARGLQEQPAEEQDRDDRALDHHDRARRALVVGGA